MIKGQTGQSSQGQTILTLGTCEALWGIPEDGDVSLENVVSADEILEVIYPVKGEQLQEFCRKC